MSSSQNNSLNNSYKRNKYRKFCEGKDIPIFQNPWWLDAVEGNNKWDVAIVEKANQIHAFMPYVKTNIFGMTKITQPKLTPFLGPWIFDSAGSYHRRLKREKDLLYDLINQLPKYDHFYQQLHFEQTNWLPFFWRGFSQSTRYTYRLNDLSNMDNLWNNFSGNVRKEIRKSKNRFNIVIREDKPLSELYALCTKTFERQKKKVSYNFSILENIDRACKERQCSKVFIAEDPKGRQHAGLYMIWDKKNAYYLTGGGDPDYRNSGATSLCFYHAISFASKVTTSFDFEGSMIESIERFFRGFGAIQTPYFAIFHTPSKRYKLLKKFKSGKDFLFENYIKK